MQEKTSSGATALSDEDRARLARLQGEIAGRLAEVGLILGRNLGHLGTPVVATIGPGARSMTKEIAEVVRRHRPGRREPGAEAGRPVPVPELYSIFCIVDDAGNCGCEDPVRGICFSC